MARPMSTTGYAMFDTRLGRCGIAWGPPGLTGVQLPAQDAPATRLRIPEIEGARFGAGPGLFDPLAGGGSA